MKWRREEISGKGRLRIILSFHQLLLLIFVKIFWVGVSLAMRHKLLVEEAQFMKINTHHSALGWMGI